MRQWPELPSVSQIETTSAFDIIFLPGAMVGLLLAGTGPSQAVQVQLVHGRSASGAARLLGGLAEGDSWRGPRCPPALIQRDRTGRCALGLG